MKKSSQLVRLEKWLIKGKTINRLQALTKLGIFELSARICELEREGYNIIKERKTVKNRYNEKISIQTYSFAQF